jgi:D-glycerate 3-kinase
LAQQLAAQRQNLDRPLVQGILGGQGTGKTTLGMMLTLILRSMGYTALSWSLDDLYKTYATRLQLQHQIPDLIWRGPPGTHDVELGIQILDQLRHPLPGPLIAIPRFDKSLHNGMGDRSQPELVQNIDIVLFEGWFVGVRPVEMIPFTNPPSPIKTERDRTFAQACNQRLHDYLPLWERLDRLWVLYPRDYHLSKQWRNQAEARMKTSGKPGMTDAEIDTFVEYFWKALHPDLFIRPTLTHADLIIEINPDHSSGAVYRGR